MTAKRAGILKTFTIVLLTALFFGTSVNGLYVDAINPDGINWHTRSEKFVDALVQRNYEGTYQAYHPGVTLMWISGPVLRAFNAQHMVDGKILDEKAIFLDADYYAKLSVVVFETILFAITLITMWKLFSFKYALFFALIFTFEPFLLGMRRLYHLDFLMAMLALDSFLFLVFYNYRSAKDIHLLLAGLFFALAVLTKSAAVMVLPAVPFIFLLGNPSLKDKLISLLQFVVFASLFIYFLFPPIWTNPAVQIPKYFEKIAFGVSDIGVEGHKEMGRSGEADNIVLDETFKPTALNYYLVTLVMRFSVAGLALSFLALLTFTFFFLKGFATLLASSIKAKKFPKTFNFDPTAWAAFWSIGLATAITIALTVAVKKQDRYEVFAFPFIVAVIAYFLAKLKLKFGLPLIAIYLVIVIYELYAIHPYYLAYSTPLLGGVETRIRVLDGSPFGVGSYAAFEVVKKDREKNGATGYYTIAGSKSIKAISAGGRFSREPSCVTDYVVSFALDEEKPNLRCLQDFAFVDTVKVGGFDYWYIFKRLNQKHESNYD